MYKRSDKLSKNQMNRNFIDFLGFKDVPITKFRKKITENVPYTIESRGSQYYKGHQKRTKVYEVGKIYDYLVSEIERIKKNKG